MRFSKNLASILGLLVLAALLIWQETVIARLAGENRTRTQNLPETIEAKAGINRISRHDWQTFLPSWTFSESRDFGMLLKQRPNLAEMNRDELLDGLHQLTELDLDEKLENDIRWSLLRFLAPLDPASALTLAVSLPAQDSRAVVSFKLKTFKILIHQDTTQAAAWLDQEIEKGTFTSSRIDGSYNPRYNFEKALVARLLRSGLSEAQARISAYSQEEKSQLFQHFHGAEHWLHEGRAPSAFVDLARATFSEHNASLVIGGILGAQKVESLEEATTLLDQSQLTEAERGKTARNLLLTHLNRNPEPPKLEDIYQWARAEDRSRRANLMTEVFSQMDTPGKTEEVIAGVFSLVDSTGDQTIIENYVKHRSGLGGASLEREIDSFKDQDLARRFRTALQQ